jgi:tRNA-2-methylthio-N6-dimethylallyladenosine synthase
VTLLGQNVDSYKWSAEENNKPGLKKERIQHRELFKLIEMVAQVSPKLRIRFQPPI